MTRWFCRGLLACGLVFCATTAHSQTAKKAAKPAKATPAETLKVAKGFKADLVYTVPAEKYGSWVNMCVDPKGRLIVSDQSGPLYRLTLQPQGEPTIEQIPANIGDAQGLLWAFDSLYVVVNSGKRPAGLYRVTSSQNNDILDRAEMLRPITGGGGEHGPHAVLLHPDGKRLTVVCGNQCKMVDCDTTKVPRHWGEDHLLPRMPDGRGFMADKMGPGGCIYNVTPDGKSWELFSSGFRNQFDAAYDRDGELFTYDADMEWDFNTPWYRPTRVCHVTSGSEFGWRNGAGKYPAYYADSWPAIHDVGPGSPTGVSFGYGAKFPQKYQNAFFIADWSYGKLYAVHLTPEGSSFKAEKEEFVSGTPLPLTDVVINPLDGAMYFLIGGRKTQSALYRVTYAGDESTAQAKSNTPITPSVRKHLEQFHNPFIEKTFTDDILRDTWTHLDSPDRFIRNAARIVLEFGPLTKWQSKALAEENPGKAITALLALVRSSATCPFHRPKGQEAANGDPKLGAAILAKLNSIDFAKLTPEQQLEFIRVYHVFFNRYGVPTRDQQEATIAKFEPAFPTGHRFVDGELAQLLTYLQSSKATPKIVAAMLKAPTQEEQIEYARALRILQAGWTPELRKQYFAWMQNADGYRGGNSFGGFLAMIKADAVKTLTPQEKVEFAAFINAKPNPNMVNATARKVVKEYKLDELQTLLEKKIATGRDFEHGRKLFAEAKCASCHRFDNEGGISGPDLTQAAGRFSQKDLLESIINPNKEISDQYAAVEIETDDGRKIIGRIVNHNGSGMVVNPNMLEPNSNITVKPTSVVEMKPSKQSMMPAGTLDVLKEDEILDLMAYLLSRGDRANPMFKK